jgi:hypothetical protein
MTILPGAHRAAIRDGLEVPFFRASVRPIECLSAFGVTCVGHIDQRNQHRRVGPEHAAQQLVR